MYTVYIGKSIYIFNSCARRKLHQLHRKLHGKILSVFLCYTLKILLSQYENPRILPQKGE